MKKLMAVVLILVLAFSFAVGILVSRVEAAKCTTSCDICTCTIIKCCDGVCQSTNRRCAPICPLIICE